MSSCWEEEHLLVTNSPHQVGWADGIKYNSVKILSVYWGGTCCEIFGFGNAVLHFYYYDTTAVSFSRSEG